MPTVISGVQYSGIWNISSQAGAQAAATWPAAYNETTLFAWGLNADGQLGLGNVANRSSPVQVGSSNWLDVAGGRYHSVALKTSGTIFSAGGSIYYPQLGVGSSFAQIGTTTTWASVSTSTGSPANIFAVKTDGTLWAWGENSYGSCGLNNTTDYSSPKQIGALTSWLSVSAGAYSCWAIRTNGAMYAWGGNSLGQLGDGTVVVRSSPVQIGALTNWLQVSGGLYRHTTAVKTDGTLWVWGRNSNGELGLNDLSPQPSSPVQVGSLTNWLYVSAGETRTYAVKTDGTMWAWGRNNQHGGELGTGDSTINRSSPTQIGALTTWSKVRGTTGGHVIALKTDGSIYGWGRNSAGQAGLGDTAVQSNPTQIGSNYNWTGIGVGQYHSFAW